LVEELRKVKSEITKLLDEGKIISDQFEYRKYNGCEIIP